MIKVRFFKKQFLTGAQGRPGSEIRGDNKELSFSTDHGQLSFGIRCEWHKRRKKRRAAANEGICYCGISYHFSRITSSVLRKSQLGSLVIDMVLHQFGSLNGIFLHSKGSPDYIIGPLLLTMLPHCCSQYGSTVPRTVKTPEPIT